MRAGSRIAPIDPDAFVRFLQRADLVKFARMEAEQEEARAAMAYVRDLVERTRPDRAAASDGGPDRSGPGDAERPNEDAKGGTP